MSVRPLEGYSDVRHARSDMAAICAQPTSPIDGLCSLMGQGRHPLPGIDALGCLCSLRARSALDGVSWVQGGSVEIAVGQRLAPATESAPSSAPSLGRRSSWELDSASCLVVCWAYISTNSVPSRSIACMMIARRRARATLALRIVDRLAILKAQSLSLSWPSVSGLEKANKIGPCESVREFSHGLRPFATSRRVHSCDLAPERSEPVAAVSKPND